MLSSNMEWSLYMMILTKSYEMNFWSMNVTRQRRWRWRSGTMELAIRQLSAVNTRASWILTSKYLQWGSKRREFSVLKLIALASFVLRVGPVPPRNMASPVGQAIGSNRFNQGLFQDITSCYHQVFTRRGHPPSMLSKSQLTVLSGSSTWLPVPPRKTAEIVLEYKIGQCNQLQRKGRQQAKVKWLCICWLIGFTCTKWGLNLMHSCINWAAFCQEWNGQSTAQNCHYINILESKSWIANNDKAISWEERNHEAFQSTMQKGKGALHGKWCKEP